VKKKKLKDEEWFAKHFPTAHARDAADKAVDALDPTSPMTTYIDVWIAAYIKAGGKTEIKV
jgi:hypothetical protein